MSEIRELRDLIYGRKYDSEIRNEKVHPYYSFTAAMPCTNIRINEINWSARFLIIEMHEIA